MPKRNPKSNPVHKQRSVQARPSQPRPPIRLDEDEPSVPLTGESSFHALFPTIERAHRDFIAGADDDGAVYGGARHTRNPTRHRPSLFYEPPQGRLPRVYQLKITVDGIVPLVWRRVLIADTATFKDLHRAIQRFFGWENYHLHDFLVQDPAIPAKKIWIQGLTNTSDDEEAALDYDFEETGVSLRNFLAIGGNTLVRYNYDFGDSWSCRIRLERSIEPDLRLKYPVCIDGKRAGPPEDSGGPSGYMDKLAIVKKKRHPEHEETKDWLGEGFNPENCDCISKDFAKLHPEGSGLPASFDDDVPAEIMPIKEEFEKLVDQGARAYNKRARDVIKAVDSWLEAWTLLSTHVPPAVHSLEEMDDNMLGLMPDFARFVRDLHRILEEATNLDEKYRIRGITYKMDVARLFNHEIPTRASK
jgi:hypothetical protein